MKAPEKIYISYEGYGCFKDDSSTERTNNSQIEYTRTDAFIDKAAIWFNNNLGHDECGVIAYQFDSEEEMFKDFIEYMKGE